MRRTLAAIALMASSAALAQTQSPIAPPELITTSARLELATSSPLSLAATLTAMGFDGESMRATGPARLALIATPEEYRQLLALGYSPRILELARPLRDRLSELNNLDSPPAGYKNNAQILAELRAAEASFPTLCKVVDAASTWGPGSTYEGRPIWVVKISDHVTQDEDEPNVLVVSCHHCREIVTPVIALEAISRLTSRYATDPAVRAVVDANEIWIAPVWNPDGYNEVFVGNSFWRKNRRPYGGSIGIDLNRNYPMGWSSSCSGSTNPGSSTFKGPSPASEAETQTMIAMSHARRFEKVLDFHSSGRETLYGYRCSSFPLQSWYQGEAILMSNAAGYSGATRVPSAEGEHYQWQLADGGAYSFLTETATSFQPAYSSAQSEANQVWGEILHLLQRPVPLTGHVRDFQTGAPVQASITVAGLSYRNGEGRSSGGPAGRYFYWAGPGARSVTFTAPGYHPTTIQVTFGATTQTREIELLPIVDIRAIAPLRIGTSVVFTMMAPLDANQIYVAIPSLTSSPPISLGGNRVLHGAFDQLTDLAYMTGFISGLSGTLNFLGAGLMTMAIPNDAQLVGLPIVMNYVTLDAIGVSRVSDPPYIGAITP